MDENFKLAFQVTLSVVGTLVLYVGTKISEDLKRLILSVEDLNIRMATKTEKIEGLDRRIDRLEIQTHKGK